ncbi:MAG: hypothetical protein IPF92_24240 [Myxococcales bacterium]|jgi:hypothetical protein|nr:hypothetical protein [Myxococcales bacterium]
MRAPYRLAARSAGPLFASYKAQLRIGALADAHLEDRVRRVLLPSLDRHLEALVALRPPRAAAGGAFGQGPLGSSK